ncbi:DJ-1/PfpI family protein [Omnitrophica bacterium]|nr:DJ-1/PfpI family protein [Candidatus Omnitrophota bacterium]
MKKVLIPVAPGFEEIETVTVVDVLRRAGADVILAGTQSGEMRGSRRVKLTADLTLDDLANQDFDLLYLPGGQPGVDNLRKDDRVKEIVRKMSGRKKWIAAICAAPLILKDAGLIKGLKLTSHPSIKDELKEAKYQEQRVVVDGNYITSRGPGTALELALKIVELLEGKDKAKGLADIMLARA